MPIDQIKNFVAVSDQIGTGGQPTDTQLREVADAGYHAVVNLGLLDPRYCLADEAGLAGALGMKYRHLPVRFEAPAVDDFKAFVAVMDEWARDRVFVHCAANYRVSGFVAVYGQLRLGWTREQADAHVRTVWTPNETWLTFLRALRTGLGLDADPA